MGRRERRRRWGRAAGGDSGKDGSSQRKFKRVNPDSNAFAFKSNKQKNGKTKEEKKKKKPKCM